MKSTRVGGNSPMVSLRLPEDYLLELDLRVGLDGTRNRSDVIREAVRKYLTSPLSTMNEVVEVDLGPDLAIRMRDFCKLHSDTAEYVLKQGAREYIRRETLEGAESAIDGSVEHFTKKMEATKGPKVVKTFEK